jgi:hypothetical protein
MPDYPNDGAAAPATRVDRDETEAWSCAANCLSYENDPGPAELNIGSASEPHMVSRSYAWRDFYARLLINQLDGSHARLLTTAEVCRHRLGTLKRRRNAEVREIWLRAIDLCELAAGIVADADADAGAVSDDDARQRLLAGNNHTLNVTALRSAVSAGTPPAFSAVHASYR